MPTIDQVLGFGLVRPFRRDRRRDFAAAGGEALVRACVAQILGTACSGGTTQGEIPWRTDFGSLLYRMRHRNNDATTQELAKAWVADALGRWEPRIAIKEIDIERREAVPGGGENVLLIRLHYDILAQPRPGSAVAVFDVEQEIAA